MPNRWGLSLLCKSPQGVHFLFTPALQHWTNQLWECKNLYVLVQNCPKSLYISLCFPTLSGAELQPVTAWTTLYCTTWKDGFVSFSSCSCTRLVLTPSLGAICASQLTAELNFYHHLAWACLRSLLHPEIGAGSSSASWPSVIMKCN